MTTAPPVECHDDDDPIEYCPPAPNDNMRFADDIAASFWPANRRADRFDTFDHMFNCYSKNEDYGSDVMPMPVIDNMDQLNADLDALLEKLLEEC